MVPVIGTGSMVACARVRFVWCFWRWACVAYLSPVLWKSNDNQYCIRLSISLPLSFAFIPTHRSVIYLSSRLIRKMQTFSDPCMCQEPSRHSQIAKFMGPTWGLHGSCRPQMGPMFTPWTLLSGLFQKMVCLLYVHHPRGKSTASDNCTCFWRQLCHLYWNSTDLSDNHAPAFYRAR